MQQLFQSLVENLDSILPLVLSLLCFLVTLFRTGSIKKSINSLMEVNNLITYKTAATAGKLPVKQQKFSETVPDYILDPATNELERSPVDKDVQAYIASYIDVALDRALERFMPKEVIDDNDHYSDYTQKSQDLAELGSAMELAENYREQYNLPDSWGFEKIMSFVGDKAAELKTKLTSVEQKPVTEVPNEKKEIE